MKVVEVFTIGFDAPVGVLKVLDDLGFEVEVDGDRKEVKVYIAVNYK